MNINNHSTPTAAVSSCGSSSERCPVLGPSQLHSSERASRPAARTAHRAQQPGEIRWDGSKKAELAGGLVLAGHYYSQSYFMAPVNWPGSARRSHAGRRMVHSQLQLRQVLYSTKFQTSWLMIKCWKQCSQCSSLHSDRVLSTGKNFQVIMML